MAGTLFFDYDGTLHDSLKLYGPAFRIAYQKLVDGGWAAPREFSDEEIAQWIGWEVRDMWRAFMPELPEAVWGPVSREIGDDMERLLQEGQGALFSQVPQTLDQLKADGWTLVLLSNCGPDYRDAHREIFGLDRWFDAYAIAADYPGLAKWQIYREIADEFPRPHVIVGDRFQDLEVATQNHLPSIGCTYGYAHPGELDSATVTVDSFDQIPQRLESLLQIPLSDDPW